jgi:hypothetical protein
MIKQTKWSDHLHNNKGNTMTLRRLLAVSCLLFPLMASAHNFVDGQRVAPVGVADRGELFWIMISLAIKTGIARSWREKCAWCSTLPDARRQKKNATLIEAIKARSSRTIAIRPPPSSIPMTLFRVPACLSAAALRATSSSTLVAVYRRQQRRGPQSLAAG